MLEILEKFISCMSKETKLKKENLSKMMNVRPRSCGTSMFASDCAD